MTSSIVSHYRATDIPYDLPTIAEIQDSEDVVSGYGNRKVVRVGRHFVVKYGKAIDIIEGENMLYVQRNTTIAVSKVYTLYTEPYTGWKFIVMEYIEGRILALAWPDLNAVQKSVITAKLRNFYNELRQLPSPGYFGSLGQRPLLNDTFWTRENVPSINGPFETEDALNEALAQKYTYDGRAYYKAEYYRQSLPHIFRSDQPTFTHEDCRHRVFVHALNTVKRIPRTGSARPPPEDRLKLYGLYKQSTEGDVQGISPRPERNGPESVAEQQKWDAWSANHSLSRTEAKRRYIATLIDTMHKYATTTPEARELVAELEFVWDQIKSNSASPLSSSPGQTFRSQGPQLPSYASIGGPPGSGRADEGGGEGLRMLRPVSEGEAAGDEGEEFEETRGGPFDDEEAVMAAAGQSRDLDVRNRKWRRKIEHALVKMSTEVAALREQIELKRIGDARRRTGLWAWMTWLVWVAVRHVVVDLALLGLLVAWVTRKEDRRVEQGLDLLLQYLRHRIRKTRVPAMLRLPAQRT